jgi:hypothetical protein
MSMRWRVMGLGTALASAMMATPPVAAQTAAPPQDPAAQNPATQAPAASTTVPGVTVTRPRQKAMNAYIDDVAQPAEHGELAVWSKAICPRVAGLAPQQAAYIENRIRQTATRLGLLAGSGGCEPNVVIAFSDTPGQVALRLKRKRYGFFQTVNLMGNTNWPVDRAKLDAFVDSSQAVRWWLSSTPFSADDPAAGALSASPGHYAVWDPLQNKIGLRESFTAALVIVDANQARGVPLEAIGSYLSMVSLAQFKPRPATSDASTILSLFDDHAAGRPYYRGLTRRDWAFLQALYRTGDMFNYNQQRAEMGFKMEKLVVGKWSVATPIATADAAPEPAP